MKTNTRNVFVGVILMIVMLLGISMLTACNDVTLDKLQNEYGIVIDGGGFEEGSTLVSNEIAVSTEEATEVLAAIADQNYDKDGSVYIFDIYVTKDGAKVQPSGKVKVSVPRPNIQVDNYLVFHVKADNSVENLVPTVADGKISFETSSFSYFIIAEAAPDEHVHDYVWVEGTEPTCEKEGAIAHYHCDGCGKNFDPNYGEVETVSIPKAEHEYGSMYWGKSANFWEDGNIEYYQCAVCEKYFDAEFNEVETVVIPKYSTNLSICVNGTPTALVLGEQHENFIEWSLEGLSVTKGDVITLCQTDNAEIGHNYFADGNVDKDGKILTTAAAANVVLTATPNGLARVFIPSVGVDIWETDVVIKGGGSLVISATDGGIYSFGEADSSIEIKSGNITVNAPWSIGTKYFKMIDGSLTVNATEVDGDIASAIYSYEFKMTGGNLKITSAGLGVEMWHDSDEDAPPMISGGSLDISVAIAGGAFCYYDYGEDVCFAIEPDLTNYVGAYKMTAGANADGTSATDYSASDIATYKYAKLESVHVHDYGTTWKSDENNHWNECECGDKANTAPHADENNDGKCDICDYAMGNAENPGEDIEPEKTGLSGGAIAGIAVGSVAVAGVGGFSLFWFVIKKKKFADLIALFKKK